MIIDINEASPPGLARDWNNIAGKLLTDIFPASIESRIGGRSPKGDGGWAMVMADNAKGNDPVISALDGAPGATTVLENLIHIWWAVDGTGIAYTLDDGKAEILYLPLSRYGGAALDISSLAGAIECCPGKYEKEDVFLSWASAWFGEDGKILSKLVHNNDHDNSHEGWSESLRLARAILLSSQELDLDNLVNPTRKPGVWSGTRLDVKKSLIIIRPEQKIWDTTSAGVVSSEIEVASVKISDRKNRDTGMLVRAGGWNNESLKERLSRVFTIALADVIQIPQSSKPCWKNKDGVIVGRDGRALVMNEKHGLSGPATQEGLEKSLVLLSGAASIAGI